MIRMMAALGLLLSLPAQAEDWPQFHGPNRDNAWNETGILKTSPADEPLPLARLQVAVATESRNMMLLCVFFSLFSISSIASTGGTPVKARRSMTTRLHSSG